MDLEHATNSFGEIASTRLRAYEKDLYDFFATMTGLSPHPALVREFLRPKRFAAVAVVLKYKAKLIDKGLKEATINRRLAAIKRGVNFARKVGECEWSLVNVEGEKVVPYRDTTGFGRVDKRECGGDAVGVVHSRPEYAPEKTRLCSSPAAVGQCAAPGGDQRSQYRRL